MIKISCKYSFSFSRSVRIIGLLAVLLFNSGIFSQSKNYFDDLTSERKPILGSEKEDKYAFRFPPFASVESWGPHFSVQTLALFSYTNYPRFKEVSFFPLYNRLWAKEGDSYRHYLVPFFYSQRIEEASGVSGFQLSLLHYRQYRTGANFSEESVRFPSFLPLFGGENSVLNGQETTFRYAVPFLFFQKRSPETNWTQFLLFHSGKDQDSSYGAIFPFLFWGSGNNRRHLSFFPLWYYDSNDSSREGSFLTPLFGQVWKDRVTVDSTEEERFSYFLPYFRNSIRENGELKRYRSFIPVLFYRKFEKDAGTNTNLLVLGGWNSDAKGDYKSSYFFPFLFHEKGEKFVLFPAYFDLGKEKFGILPAPFYYYRTATSSQFYILNTYYSKDWKESTFLFFPLFYRNVKLSERTTVAPLFFRNRTEDRAVTYFLNSYWETEKNGNWSFLFFPLFAHSQKGDGYTNFGPIWYRDTEGKSSRTLFVNTYLSWNKEGEFDRGIFFPLLYYKSKEYFHIFPVYFDTSREKFGLFPFPFYHYDDSYRTRTYALNMLYSSDKNGDWSFLFFPLFYRSHTGSENTTFAPAFYRNSDGLSSRNYILNSYWSYNKSGELDRAIFFPLLFYKSNDYFSLLPFLIKGNRTENEYTLLPALLTYWDEDRLWIANTYLKKDSKSGDYRRVTIFPFWSYTRNEEERSYLLFPLFYRTINSSETKTVAPLYYSYHSSEKDYSLYFLYETFESKKESTRRIYPFYFSGSDDGGSYWNFLGLAGRGFGKEGDAEYSYAFPLYFYKKDSYRLFIPFFFRLGYDEKHYRHFGIFHYWNRSPEKDNTWIWPLLWFSNVDKVRKEDFTTWFPLYWNWNTPRSKGDILLPFYLNYEEADKSLQLVLAYSYSQSLGNFGGSAGVGSNDKEYFIDTDLGVFYNLFSLSKRTAIPKDQLLWWRENHPEEQAVKETPVPAVSSGVKQEEKVGINRYHRLLRENVRSFWGVSALFGIFSYEEGDDRRHLRLLPLSWFSWSKTSDNKVYAAPFFFYSRIADESYLLVFPFYGRQSQAEDYLESYLLLGFLRSKQGETKDYSVLWPLTRLYYSPDSWGFRFFPLVSHEETKTGTRTLSLLYYRNLNTEGSVTSSSFHSIALPLIHYNYETTTTDEGTWKKGTDMFLPFYLRNSTATKTASGEFSYGEVYTPLSRYKHANRLDGTSSSEFISPLYYFSRERKAGQSEEEAQRLDFLPIPWAFWQRDSVSSKFFLLGYYSERTEVSNYTTFLGLVSSSETRTGTRIESSFRMFPFYFYGKETDGNKILSQYSTVPILFSWSREKDKRSLNILGFLNSVSSDSEDSFAFLPFFYKISQTENSPQGITESRTLYTPLAKYESRKESNGTSVTSFLSPFYYSYRFLRGGEPEENATKLDFYLIPGLYWERSPKESTFFLLGFYRERTEYSGETSFLGLISSYDFHVGTRTKESFQVVPFYFSSSEKDGEKELRSSRTIPILYHSSREGESSSWNVLGLLNGTKSETEESFALYPFVSITDTKSKNFQTRTVWGIPFYYDKTEYVGGNSNSLSVNPLGVFTRSNHNSYQTDTAFWFLPIPTLYYEKSVSPLGIVDRELSFLELITYKSREDTKEGKVDKTEFSAFLFASGKSETYPTQSGFRSESQYYIFPLFWLGRESLANQSKTHLNFLIFADYSSDSVTKSSRLILGPFFHFAEANSRTFGIFPLAFWQNDTNSNSWGVLPLVFRKKEVDYSFWFALGAYGYSDSEENRWGFAGLVDTSYESKRKRRNLNLFLGLIHTELEESRTQVAILGGVLGGYEGRPDYSDANFLWLRYRSSPGDTLANFLPVYYYHRDADGTAALVPPILGYFSSEKDGRFDMLGLGLLYYRNQRISKEEDLMLVGPGLFYYKQTPTAMGLHSMGILALPVMGGLLWDWEYETRTNYSRYSILNILYSRTTRKDGTQFSRILGFKIE